MKKMIALAMVLGVLGSIVAGCGDKATESSTTETSTAGGTSTTKTTTETDK